MRPATLADGVGGKGRESCLIALSSVPMATLTPWARDYKRHDVPYTPKNTSTAQELCVAWIVVVQKTILIPSVTSWSSGMTVSNKGSMGTTEATRSEITSSVAKGTARI